MGDSVSVTAILDSKLNFIRVIKEQGGIGFVCDDAKNLKNMLDAFMD